MQLFFWEENSFVFIFTVRSTWKKSWRTKM